MLQKVIAILGIVGANAWVDSDRVGANEPGVALQFVQSGKPIQFSMIESPNGEM